MNTFLIIVITAASTHLLDLYGVSGVVNGVHTFIQSVVAKVSGAVKGGAAVAPASPASPSAAK